ncbi:hypothetical protein QEP77_17245 [Serratia sp. B1]|nr:hypothetical protein QEP77_17245 [Serratia sp. B1]
MTTIKRFTPDYKMHAVRFEAFAREAEHGELVQFDDHQQVVSTLEAERDALAMENAALKKFGDKLNEMHNDLNGEGTGIQGRAEVVCQQAAIEAAMDEFDAITTPTTDAALAAIQAQAKAEAIEQLAIQLEQLPDDAFDVLSDEAEFETYQEEHHTFVSISNPRAVANAVISLVKEQSTELREAK